MTTCYQSYIICSTPRSGSTLLCKLLAATGKSGKPDSHFHSPSVDDWIHYYNVSPGNLSTEQDLLAAIFQAARHRGDGGTGMFGLRIQRQSFDYFIQKLRVLYPGHSSDHARIQEAFGKTLFIHLTRHNKLQQAISYVKATQTGLWHRAPNGTDLERLSAPQAPFYDAEAIAARLTEFTDMDAQWNSWFMKENLAPLRISYERLASDPIASLADILGHLGLDQKHSHHISLPVSKLADTTNENWEIRFNS